jgi:hypothetical protein
MAVEVLFFHRFRQATLKKFFNIAMVLTLFNGLIV